jgi:hypothetical protein
MSHNGNWFAVSRLIFDHPVVGIQERSFTDLEAWLWLLAEAAFEPLKVNNKGTIIILDPGQMMHARSYLAKRWDWTEDKVRWFLKRLQNEAMINRFCTQQNPNPRTNQIQIITICNYGQYQFSQANQQPAEPPPSHPANTQPAPSQHPQDNNKTLKQKEEKKSAPAGAADDAKGTRLPKNWQLPTEYRDWALKEIQITPEHVEREASQFRDYWVGLPSAKGRKADWFATWRNWVRRNHSDRQASDGHHASGVKRPAPYWWRDRPERACNLPPEVWRSAVSNFANGTWPIETLGPPPGAEGCLIPRELVEDMGLAEIYTEEGSRRT